MKGYKIEFEIYAEDEQEALDGRNAIVAFISELAYNGSAVTGNKIVLALKKWKENMFVRNKIIDFFKPYKK